MEMFKQLKELASKISEVTEKIADVTKQLNEVKYNINELDYVINNRKTLIARRVLFEMSDLKNEAQRNNQISIECMSDGDLKLLTDKQAELKKELIHLEYEKDLLRSQNEYYMRMYQIIYLQINNNKEQSSQVI